MLYRERGRQKVIEYNFEKVSLKMLIKQVSLIILLAWIKTTVQHSLLES